LTNRGADMARKYSRSRRFAPSTERALFKDQQLSGRHIDRTDLMDAIRGGEDSYLEFKVRFSNPEKLAAGICALANSGGGTIVFGVTDQLRLEGVSHPELIEQDLLAICREQIVPPVWGRVDKVAFDSGLRILVFEVDARRAPHRTVDGRYYVRVGAAKREATGEEIAELYRGRTGARGFEDTPLLHADPETDIDEASLWTYVREITNGNLEVREDYPTASLLGDMRLAVRYGEALVPTVAGILLFGKGAAVAKRIPHSPLVARRVSGSDASDQVVEEVEFVGNVASLYERAVQFVERFADLWEQRPRRRGSAPVAARPYLPREPVLEAIVNALAHRDYANHAPVRVTLFDDRLDVVNPAPDAGLTRRSLRFGLREPTNPRVKAVLLSPAYGVARSAGGVPMLLSATREFTRNEPARITIGPDAFRVEIPAV
jgi:ATP-dependent DNA helicase RecG